MTKLELAMLERAYSAEIESALSRNPISSVIQTKSKVAAKLADEGFLVRVERTPITTSVYRLSVAGRMAYCRSCDASSNIMQWGIELKILSSKP